jgi:hypothetical protein
MHEVHVVLSAQVIALLSVLLPAATAAVTKRFADSAVKALTLLALAIVASVFGGIVADGGGFDVGATAWTVFITFLTGALMHFGLLEPLKVTGKHGAIAKATADVGIGDNAAQAL